MFENTKKRLSKDFNFNNISIGDLFALSLPNGDFGVVHIIDSSENRKQETIFGKNTFLVGGLEWIGKSIPKLGELMKKRFFFSKSELLPIIHQISFSWNNKPLAGYMGKLQLKEKSSFIFIGNVSPNNKEQNIVSNSIFGENQMALFILQEWRWKNDKAALLREREQEKKQKKLIAADLYKKEKDRIADMTLKEFKEENFFENWKEFHKKTIIKESHDILKNTIEELMILDLQAQKEKIKQILKQCVEQFNNLDKKYGGFIETIEREDICEYLSQLMTILKVENLEDSIGQWRNW